MYWYEKSGPECDVVLSTRVRLARNLEKTPFPALLDKAGKEKVVESVKAAYKDSDMIFADFGKLGNIERQAYAQAHLCSVEFASQTNGSMLVLNKTGSLSVMVNEEDHIRLQVIKSGYDPKAAYKEAFEEAEKLENSLPVAYMDTLGYLTACPTNLGSGMRISIMAHLPAMTAAGTITKLANTLSKIGFTIRGMYGEGSSGLGCLYQISNQMSKWQSSEEILKSFEATTLEIIESERKARRAIYDNNKLKIEDTVSRALGEMKYARIMNSREFIELYSKVRLGLELGIITELGIEKLDRMLVELMPANLCLIDASALDVSVRDEIRAKQLKKMLQ